MRFDVLLVTWESLSRRILVGNHIEGIFHELLNFFDFYSLTLKVVDGPDEVEEEKIDSVVVELTGIPGDLCNLHDLRLTKIILEVHDTFFIFLETVEEEIFDLFGFLLNTLEAKVNSSSKAFDFLPNGLKLNNLCEFLLVVFGADGIIFDANPKIILLISLFATMFHNNVVGAVENPWEACWRCCCSFGILLLKLFSQLIK